MNPFHTILRIFLMTTHIYGNDEYYEDKSGNNQGRNKSVNESQLIVNRQHFLKNSEKALLRSVYADNL